MDNLIRRHLLDHVFDQPGNDSLCKLEMSFTERSATEHLSSTILIGSTDSNFVDSSLGNLAAYVWLVSPLASWFIVANHFGHRFMVLGRPPGSSEW